MLTEDLKIHTKDAHLSVERLIIKKIQCLQTTEDYIDLLKIFYGYFSALEEQIVSFINTNKLPDFAERRKTESLLSDIKSLSDANILTPQKANDLPAIASHTEALGALYVIEGSTLGGKIISKMISQKLGADAENALKFFQGYGERTEEKWEAFKNSLNCNVQSEPDIKLTLSAALETFEKFKKWIERYDRNEKL